MKKLILFFLFLSVWTLGTQAQTLDHVLGDILIQMKPGEDIRHITRQLQSYNGVPAHIKVQREISPPMRIWLVHFDFASINENYFLNEVRNMREVEVAQFNHIIAMRETVPDDPFFNQQWQWVNTGQGGGTPDADVDADEAWDLTTGGTTATGDEIVVCVVEGTNRNHPDLQGNLWFNEDEIPDNGIDDDGNGYVDDYEGWNIQTGDDNVNPESHGTTVAGMIGAKGNNGRLVTGINWDVKIMNVDFQGVSEANSLAAYTYPYVMRKRYNETGGQSGAFVVATNSSWGLDNGQPADAPLWCAFYDSLGAVGILSCGATANNNVNIDVVGDLPTACPSEFMVAVTATNNHDVRTFSGYGVENIDVGAPGEQIVNINQNGGPTTTSGTSFASPLTAGIIALLYSAPCSSLGPQALADPAGTALLVRDALYEGVDTTSLLMNEVKYGGRVNAYNSLLLFLQSCGPCPKPYGLAFTEGTDHRAVVIDHERLDPRARLDLARRLRHRLQHPLHPEGPALARDLGLVSARRRTREIAIRGAIFAGAVDQAIVRGRLHPGLRVEAALERHPTRFKPVEVLDALLAEQADLVHVGARLRHRDQETEHLPGAVFEAGRPLDRGAPTQVEHAPRIGGGPTSSAGALERQHVRTRRAGLVRRAGPGDAKADDEHVRLPG